MVLQRAGDDLGGGGGAAVDHHDDGLAAREVALAGVVALRVLGVAAAGRDDLALVEEGVGDGDRLVEQAARIVAKVDHEALELVLADLGGEVRHLLAQVLEGPLGEGGDAQVADLVLDAGAHGLDGDDVADDLDIEGLVDAPRAGP